MRRGFTLIELLIVLVIMVLVMGVVVPMGAKMLDSYEKRFAKMEKKADLYRSKAYAFFTLQEREFHIDAKHYTATIKGVIVEKRHDHR
ncbi:MAG: prepilin-type N-terminal cleavage/methylation domain-containing protein [Sulfurovum sp.]|nr:prepilin-type N-terminal cleavage/methylation domain-containing protein [Sulfurovum sp.]